MLQRLTIALVACAFSSAGLGAQEAAVAPKPLPASTLAGVYSEVQAARGEIVYKATCLECHVPEDYTDEAFKSKFVGGTVFDMWDLIRSSMPQNNPGSLSNTEYADVVAYLFKLNGLPAREADMPLAADSLKAIKVEAKSPAPHLTLTMLGVRRIHGSPRIR